MSDDIEKARAAHAALVAAKEACEAAGLGVRASTLRDGDALAQIIERGAAHVVSMERRAVPIAFGDMVTVYDVNARGRSPERLPVVRVGRTLVYIAQYGRDDAYRLDDGKRNDDYGHTWIDPDDLARIKRDLVGKRPPKPAPTMREVGTVTTATKGDDE